MEQAEHVSTGAVAAAAGQRLNRSRVASAHLKELRSLLPPSCACAASITSAMRSGDSREVNRVCRLTTSLRRSNSAEMSSAALMISNAFSGRPPSLGTVPAPQV